MAAVELEKSLDEELDDCEREIEQHAAEWRNQKAKLGYLASLAESRDEEDEQCVICTESYQQGWIFEWLDDSFRSASRCTDMFSFQCTSML